MTETHIQISGKCIAPAYRENIYFSKDDKYTFKSYPIKKGIAKLPNWFEIDDESKKALIEAEKKLKSSKVKTKESAKGGAPKVSNKTPAPKSNAVKPAETKETKSLV